MTTVSSFPRLRRLIVLLAAFLVFHFATNNKSIYSLDLALQHSIIKQQHNDVQNLQIATADVDIISHFANYTPLERNDSKRGHHDGLALPTAVPALPTTDAMNNESSTMSSPNYESILSPSGQLQCWDPSLRCKNLRKNMTTVNDTERFSGANNLSQELLSRLVQGSRTLALVEPILQDGYRNQFMRFVSLTVHALTHGFDKVLLPSIRWNCYHGGGGPVGIPFEVLFDVEYWNNDPELPRLTKYNQSEHFDWDPRTGLFQGACDVLDTFLLHSGSTKYVMMHQAEHYQHPVPYGGGNSLGNSFYNYQTFDAKRPTFSVNGQNTTFIDLERKITRAMRPTPALEKLIRETLGNGGQPPYVALHARFEPDMMEHSPCQHLKVFNLTDVFDMIRDMNHSKVLNPSMYIAINLKDFKGKLRWQRYQNEHRRNTAALLEVMTMGLDLPSGENLNVSVGGHTSLHLSDFDTCTHEILSSVVSFEIAVRAKMFIGTYVSSWSTTVWKARYYLGHGENYAFTPNGLEKIEGVPNPFRC